MTTLRGSSSTQRANAAPAGHERNPLPPFAPKKALDGHDVETLKSLASELWTLGSRTRAGFVRSIAERLNATLTPSLFEGGRKPVLTVNDAATLLVTANYAPELREDVRRIAAQIWDVATAGAPLPAGLGGR